MRRIRVLHTKSHLSYDGATIFLYNVAEELKNEVQFDFLIYTEEGNDWAYKFEELGGKVYCREAKNQNPIFSRIEKFKLYYQFLHEHKYNIIHVDTDDMERVDIIFCAWLCHVKKRIFHSHSAGTESQARLLRIPIYRWLLKQLIAAFSTDLLACSMDAAKWMFPSRNLPKVKLVKNGIKIKNFIYNSDARQKIRSEYSLHDCYVIGCVARFAEQKNYNFLIDIFSEIAKVEQRARLLLIGDGVLKNDIIQKVDNLKLSDKVIFVGNVDNVRDYLSAMDLFVLPSKNEGLGIVFIEAQTNGLYCLASNMVPKEAKVSKRIEFIDINASANYWAKCALLHDRQIDLNSRKEMWEETENAGYDIHDTAQLLLQLYSRQ